jgi:hypothetical protein
MLERHVGVLSCIGGGQEHGCPVTTSPQRRLPRQTRKDLDVLGDCVDADVLVGILADADHPRPHYWQLFPTTSLLGRRQWMVWQFVLWVVPMQLALQELRLPHLAVVTHRL